MKNPVIDIGNSRTKTALFGEDRLLASPTFDRKAATVGAWHMPMQKPALAIDFGTCMTYLVVASNACLEVGISSGLRVELEGFIAAYRENFPEISDYLCRGNDESFDSFAKDHIFVVPNLVLFGLNCILNHHVA